MQAKLFDAASSFGWGPNRTRITSAARNPTVTGLCAKRPAWLLLPPPFSFRSRVFFDDEGRDGLEQRRTTRRVQMEGLRQCSHALDRHRDGLLVFFVGIILTCRAVYFGPLYARVESQFTQRVAARSAGRAFIKKKQDHTGWALAIS